MLSLSSNARWSWAVQHIQQWRTRLTRWVFCASALLTSEPHWETICRALWLGPSRARICSLFSGFVRCPREDPSSLLPGGYETGYQHSGSPRGRLSLKHLACKHESPYFQCSILTFACAWYFLVQRLYATLSRESIPQVSAKVEEKIWGFFILMEIFKHKKVQIRIE